MKEYLISLMSLAILCGVVGILSPRGDIGKYIKFIMGLCALGVIISPIKVFVQSVEGFAPSFGDTLFDSNEDYYENLFNNSLSEGSKAEIERLLEKNISEKFNVNTDGFDVSVSISEAEEKATVEKVVLTIYSSGILLDGNAAINYIDSILECSCVVVYE